MRLLSLIGLLAITSLTMADPPRRRIINCPPVIHAQQIVTESVINHQIVSGSINAATIYADTHLHIIEVPTPAFVFQNLVAYQPAPTAVDQGQQTQQQIQQPPVQQSQVQQQLTQETYGQGSDETLRALLFVKRDTTPLYQELSQKCSSCHSAQNNVRKGGLAIFDVNGQFNPVGKLNQPVSGTALANRASSTEENAMPPGVLQHPEKRLSDQLIQLLRQP